MTAVLVSIILSIFVYHVTAQELKQFVFSAFEKKMLGNTLLVLILKEFLSFTGVLPQLPDALAKLPLPTYLIFGLLFFLATIISGSTAAIAMGTPLAFAAIPGGAPLMIYLMCMQTMQRKTRLSRRCAKVCMGRRMPTHLRRFSGEWAFLCRWLI